MPSPSIVLLRTQSDARLVALAREGHERAFEAIVERYRRQLLRACRRLLPDARAEDALQQALVAAWRGLERGDEVRELRPWLHRIAHNTALNLLRQSGYDYEELQESLRIADAGEEELERRAVVRQTLQGLASLPPRQREALLAIAVEGRSQDEVAGELGLSTGAVRQLVHRARSALRAAATALVPPPVVAWAAATAPRGELPARIAELTAGAGGAGATAVLAKAGTVVVLAGGAVAGPALVERRGGGPQDPAAAAASAPEAQRAAPRRSPAGSAGVTVAAQTAAPRTSAPRREADPRSPAAGAPRPASTRRRDDDRERHSGGTRSGAPDDDHSGRGPSGDSDDPVEPEPGDDSSGPGGGGSEPEPEDHSGPSLRSGSSGSGSGSDSTSGSNDDGPEEDLAEPAPTPVDEVEPELDSSGPGSGGGHGEADD